MTTKKKKPLKTQRAKTVAYQRAGKPKKAAASAKKADKMVSNVRNASYSAKTKKAASKLRGKSYRMGFWLDSARGSERKKPSRK